jgi:hypothetical protein
VAGDGGLQQPELGASLHRADHPQDRPRLHRGIRVEREHQVEAVGVVFEEIRSRCRP